MVARARSAARLGGHDAVVTVGSTVMGLLTFSLNVTLDGCVDHQEGIADDETHAFFTHLMDECGAMLWGRVTYEMMESYWPAVARGDQEAPPAMRAWSKTSGSCTTATSQTRMATCGRRCGWTQKPSRRTHRADTSGSNRH